MTLDQNTIERIVGKIVHLMETKCIALNGTRPDWRGIFSSSLKTILASRNQQEFEVRISEVLNRGGLSHVAFFHESGQRAPARYAINATFMATNEALPRWMFQDVHEGGPAYQAGIRPGDILVKIDGQPVRPPSLPSFSLGVDANLVIEDANGRARPATVVLPKADPSRRTGKPPMAEPTAVTARLLEDGIGYLKVAFFPGANGQRFARELDAALGTIPECDRLIVDLRGNLGGFVGSLRLMSYLTPGRVPVGYSMTRAGQDRGLHKEQLVVIDRLPATTFDMLKMAFRFKVLHRDRSVRLTTEGLGPQRFHGHVTMLINEHTCSAGEMVAAFAAENGLATLIGTRTSGQVLGGGNFPVGHGFILRLPAAGWFMWSGTVVEGVGVSPHVGAMFSPLNRAPADSQLATAIDISHASRQVAL
jgi:C-terminal processing protease CtpA/Prc